VTQEHRPEHGVLLDRTIQFLRPTKAPIKEIERALAHATGEPTWSHHQVAVPKEDLDLKKLRFKETNVAIPLPGEDWGTKSWRRGPLHAHESGPVYLIHKDEDSPGLMHAIKDVPKALMKRLFENIQPFVKEKTAMDPMNAGFLDELEKIAKKFKLLGDTLVEVDETGHTVRNGEKIAYGAEPSPRGNFLLASHGRVTIPLNGQSPPPVRGVPMPGQEKDADWGATWSPGDFKRVDINKKTAGIATTPAGRMASTRATGMAPGSFLRHGPSVAEIGRTVGKVLPVATKA
jgi:hypothetical protein